ncbi:nitroreductase family protein [Hathewaya massiliensis]|uniref:nitroreductase family protein n=1 Tax=Hathewaya massiliensis TaxID=1964382 RepID=UPI001158DD36|nr:nitroreductase family protein [Hathewaya massiliensis]
MSSLWDFKVDISKLYKAYHYASINDEVFTTAQIYKLPKKEDNDLAEKNLSNKLIYNANNENDFEKIIYNRHSWPREFHNNNFVDFDFISKFLQIAFIGGDKCNRNYPAGGAQYLVNTYLLFNENRVDKRFIEKGNVCKIDFQSSCLEHVNSLPWSEIEKAFIQKECVSTAQFAIALSVNLDEINGKYLDIAYKLVQQEAGHIGQNIQLVSQYMNLESLPLGGFYDIRINNIIKNSQTALYCFLIG